MFDSLKKMFEKNAKTISLKAVEDGRTIPMDEVNDQTFAQELLGPGIAIVPSNGTVVSPINGTIATVMDTKETYYALATEYITQEKSDTRLTVSSDGTKISFEIFCAENQSLHVGLRINYPHKSNGVFYELTQWQTISSITEEPDTTLHLLGS